MAIVIDALPRASSVSSSKVVDGCLFDLLPGAASIIARMIGFELTMAIVERYGGVRLYVPTPDRLTEEHELSRTIGYDAAYVLSVEFGGQQHFDIPRCVRAMRETRNRMIMDDRISGLSRRDLALKYRLTERQIDNITANAAGIHTADMFDAFK